MKKTFKRADGTEVTVEGTAEELAAYERSIQDGKKPGSIGEKKGKKDVLQGKGLQDLFGPYSPDPYAPPPAACWRCGRGNCRCDIYSPTIIYGCIDTSDYEMYKMVTSRGHTYG